MGKNNLVPIGFTVLVILIAAAGLYYISTSGLSPQAFTTSYVAPDQYYDYVPSVSAYAVGQPITISIMAQEKGNLPISSCVVAIPIPNCNGNYNNEPWCRSKTIFNARSVRVMIDGTNIANSYYYPNPDQAIGYSLSPGLPTNVGPVCCWGYGGSCSVCSDQNNAGLQYHRAFLFSSPLMPASQTINGSNVFTLTIIPPALAPGEHTLSIDYYADTRSTGAPWCSNAAPIDMNFEVAGLGFGDQNNKVNTQHIINFVVANGTSIVYENQTVYVNQTIYFENTTQIAALEAERAQLLAQIQNLSAILAQTQYQLELTQTEIAGLYTVIQNINGSLNTAQSSINLLQVQIDDLQNIIITTQAELDQTSASLIALQANYEAASNALEVAQAAQIQAQIQLNLTLTELYDAQDAIQEYHDAVDALAAELLATNLLTDAQSAQIVFLQGEANAQEAIANQALLLAAQREAEAQAALAEVYELMQEKAEADLLFQIQMAETLAQLQNTSLSLDEKIALLNDQSALLQQAYDDNVDAQAALAAANAALMERQSALSAAQQAIADLQLANAALQAQLSGESPIPFIPAMDGWVPVMGGVLLLVGFAYGGWYFFMRRK